MRLNTAFNLSIVIFSDDFVDFIIYSLYRFLYRAVAAR